MMIHAPTSRRPGRPSLVRRLALGALPIAFSCAVPSSVAALGLHAENLAIANTWGLIAWGIGQGSVLILQTLGSAENGQPLGARWSSVWAPIHAMVPVMWLLPLAAGGATAAQSLVHWIGAPL